jgi:predicted SAM-dependent methyltransferase
MKKILDKVLKFSIANSLNYRKEKREASRLLDNSTKVSESYLSNNQHPKLQIGSGINEVDGWLNTDLFPPSDQVAFLDASKRFPFEDNTFDFIFSEHIFEHLKFKESCNMISECFRILKPNGVMRLAIPSADFLFEMQQNPELPIHKEYIKWATDSFCTDVLEVFGSEMEYSEIYVINNFYRNWGHQVLHNYESLERLLLKLKFSSVQKREIGSSEIKEFCDMEHHGGIIPEKFNQLETIVIEAKKAAN